ncbi:MAG: GAF domain-containing protein, partial [Actinomycetota bacterium]|nr:GAF domain-containing protein [Actinomycetota bacterium]
ELEWWRELRLDLDRKPSGIATAARERVPVPVPAVETSSVVNRTVAEAVGARSAAFVPMFSGERVLGVLAVATTDEERDFPPGELALLQVLASQAGLALELSGSEAALAEALKQQESLLKAAQAVTSELRLETVLQRLVAELTQLLGSDAADCYLLDPERGVLHCAAVHGLDRRLVGWAAPADRGLSGQALRSGRAVLSDEYPDLRFEVPNAAYDGFARAIVAPMVWAGETRGIVGVGTRDTERMYRRRDVAAVEVFASLAGLALRNAESFEQSAHQARIQRAFYRIAAVLSEPLSRDETLAAIAQAATEALGGAFAVVLAPRLGELRVTGSFGLPAALAEALREGLPDGAEILASCAEERRILVAPSFADDDRFGDVWRRAAAGVFSSLLAVPLEHREASGLVVVFFAEPRAFTDDDLELARHVSQAARGALERSELFEAERTAHTLARQLARTGGRLAVELDPEAVVAEVVQEAPVLLAADAAGLWALDGDVLLLRAGEGEEVAAAVGTRMPSSARPAGDAVQAGTPVALASAAADAAAAGDPLLGAVYDAYVGVPLVGAEGSLHGVLAVYARSSREWRAEEIQALAALAGNASAALSNAELYQRVALEKDRSDAILGSIADGIVALDREGKVVLWNAAAEHITGVPASEALERTPEDVLQRGISPEDDPPGGRRLVRIMRGGEEVWLSVAEAVMRDSVGGIAGRVFAFRDVSAERSVEQLKSDFVASVSHELRAPLTSIFGFAETLLGREGLFGEEERRTFLRYIVSESERLTSIVEQLLNVARLEAGDLEVDLGRVELAPVVSDAIAQAERLEVIGAHRFVVDVPAEPLHVVADREKLRQVIVNLLDNSIKYSPDGGTITVSAGVRAGVAEVRVADEGAGIAQSEQQLIFHKLYRGTDAAGLSRPGAGLGLFIAQGLVNAMGGRMWLASGEGEGSSFAFELPVATSDAEGR